MKGLISREICGNYMKDQQQKKLFYGPILQLTKYLKYLYFDFGNSYLMI